MTNARRRSMHNVTPLFLKIPRIPFLKERIFLPVQI
jgi:hypothetical protein